MSSRAAFTAAYGGLRGQLGLDTPSTFGMAFGVIGPCYLATKDAHLTWQVAMATPRQGLVQFSLL